MKSLHILRPGTFSDESGKQVTLTGDDITAIASTYNPSLHEAPLVIGHPKSDSPAYGWVRGLRADDSGLHAEPNQVDSAFAEQVKDGKFKKVSVSLYGPGHPNNPTPDNWHLRHVGFLGAKPPAVKGLRQIAFADEVEPSLVVDVDLADMTVQPYLFGNLARMMRRLREWIIESNSLEKADEVIPEYYVKDLEDEVDRLNERDSEPAPALSEPEEIDMSLTETQLAEKNTELKQRENDLAKREAGLAEQETTARKETIRATIDKHVEAGRILPRQVDTFTALAELAADSEDVISLADADGKEQERSLGEALETALSELPVQVDFSEQSRDDGTRPGNVVQFHVPAGRQVGNTDQYQQAVQFAEKNNITVLEAIETLGSKLTSAVGQ